MKKLENFLDFKYVKTLFEIVDIKNHLELEKFIVEYIDILEFSNSTKKRKTECLIDLYTLYGFTDLFFKFVEYYSTSSTKEKIRLRYGNDTVEKYENNFSSRSRGKVVSRFTQKYWIDKGYSIHEAIDTISTIQQKNSSYRNKESYKNFSLKCKISIDYWVNIGYTIDEAEILRQPFLLNCKNDLESLILKYGEELGEAKYISRCKNYANSMREHLSSKKTGGYVSKESLKFFIPLYKFCRKLGINRKNIYFGISGSREFFIKNKSLPINSGYFYDFTIPALNIIIEYNGTFWHPRDITTWRNPFFAFTDAKSKDDNKRLLSEQVGFTHYVVWSDDDKSLKFNELCDIIAEAYAKQIA